MPRLYGNILPIFTLKLLPGGTAASFANDLKGFEISSKERSGDDLTFAEAASGQLNEFTLKATIVATFDTGSLYSFLWANPGKSVDVVFNPWGKASPATDTPNFTFTAQLPGKPGLASKAATDTSKSAEIDVEFKITGDITKTP